MTSDYFIRIDVYKKLENTKNKTKTFFIEHL